MTCSFIPPYLLEQIARSDAVGAAARATATLTVDARLRDRRATDAGADDRRPTDRHRRGGHRPRLDRAHRRQHHDAARHAPCAESATRPRATPPSTRPPTASTARCGLFAEVFDRSSYDGAGADVSLTVHYGRDYDNAFWDGTQLVFGDGDGEIFDRFTKPVDVLGHELTHAVTEHSAGLRYQGQSGALNESVSDVFGSCLKQWLLGQTVDQADWLIGAGLFLPGVNARGPARHGQPRHRLRRPPARQGPPGRLDGRLRRHQRRQRRRAPQLRHPQPRLPPRGHRDRRPRRGRAPARSGTPPSPAAQVGPDTDFAGFAAATVAAAGEHADAVRQAWETVGVTPAGSASTTAPTTDEPDTGETLVVVRRTGGFAGRTTEGSVDLTSHDARVPEVRTLVDRIDLAHVPGGNPHPDMFVYDFDLCGRRAQVPEQHLTPDLSRLAVIVLEAGDHSLKPFVRDRPAGGPAGPLTNRCQARARSRAALTCSVVQGMTGSSTSACETSSSISVQPSRIARAPASQSSSVRATTRRRVASTTRPCTSSS